MSQAPAAALMQVWMRTPSPGAAVVTTPKHKTQTTTTHNNKTQPKQKPNQHPQDMSSPACSAAARIGVAPSTSSVRPDLPKLTVPPSPVTRTRGRKRSV